MNAALWILFGVLCLFAILWVIGICAHGTDFDKAMHESMKAKSNKK
jgi:hypothetical protein